jgi:hypothetical protein
MIEPRPAPSLARGDAVFPIHRSDIERRKTSDEAASARNVAHNRKHKAPFAANSLDSQECVVQPFCVFFDTLLLSSPETPSETQTNALQRQPEAMIFRLPPFF